MMDQQAPGSEGPGWDAPDWDAPNNTEGGTTAESSSRVDEDASPAFGAGVASGAKRSGARKKKAGRKKATRKKAVRKKAAGKQDEDAPEAEAQEPPETGRTKKAGKRKKAARRARASESSEESAEEETPAAAPSEEAQESSSSRSSGRRPARRRSGRAAEEHEEQGAESRAARRPDRDRSDKDRGQDEEDRGGESGESGGRPRRKRSSSRSRGSRSVEPSSEEAASDHSASADQESEPRRAGRKRGRRGSQRASENLGEEREPRSDREDAQREEAPRRLRKSNRRRGADDSAGETPSREASGRKKSRRRGRGRDSEDAERENEEQEAPASRGASSRGRGRASASASSERTGASDRAGKRKGKRRRRKSLPEALVVEAIPGEEDDLPMPAKRTDEDSLRGRKGKKTSRKGSKKEASEKDSKRSSKRVTRSKETEVEIPRNQLILVNSIDHEEQRVAVVENGRIIDFLMTSESQKTLVSDIYRGKVVNLEPAIGAAFVDFGQGRNGFLHTSDVLEVYGEDGFTLDRLLTTSVDPDDWNENTSGADISDDLDDEANGDDGGADSGGRGRGKKAKGRRSSKKSGDGAKDSKERGRPQRRRPRRRLPITDLINVGDQVVVQITKDAIGDKGPTLTTYISIPGRYLVLMPSLSRTGVSRKIEDEKERRRLKRILQSLDLPIGMGVIVRTAGVGRTKVDLKRDLEYLLGVWANFGKRLKSGRGPLPLYQESDLAIRTMRDLFNRQTEAVIVDDPLEHEKLLGFADKLMPEHMDRIRLHDGERPIFHHYSLEQDFEKIFSRRVELPSGGSVVFDQTEALVAIDVNSGRTRTDSFDFEAIALKTNLDAVPEIARQIRLRDLGGIIVCDFIDMMRASNLRLVERTLRDALAGDRARSKLGRISQFGLLEMTRQRLGPGTHKKVFQSCPRCRGTAFIRTVQSRSASILRRLGSALTQKGFSTVEVRAHPEVIEYLKKDLHDYVRALEHRFEKELKLTSVPDQPEDSVLRYLRADGREVRPGGRRKR